MERRRRRRRRRRREREREREESSLRPSTDDSFCSARFFATTPSSHPRGWMIYDRPRDTGHPQWGRRRERGKRQKEKKRRGEGDTSRFRKNSLCTCACICVSKRRSLAPNLAEFMARPLRNHANGYLIILIQLYDYYMYTFRLSKMERWKKDGKGF